MIHKSKSHKNEVFHMLFALFDKKKIDYFNIDLGFPPPL